MRVLKPGHRLPREVVNAPSLEMFKARLDGALSNLIHLKLFLVIAGGLGQMALKGPFQPKPFYGSCCANTVGDITHLPQSPFSAI